MHIQELQCRRIRLRKKDYRIRTKFNQSLCSRVPARVIVTGFGGAASFETLLVLKGGGVTPREESEKIFVFDSVSFTNIRRVTIVVLYTIVL